MEIKIEKQAYRIAEFCLAHGVSRSFAYKEIKAERLKTTKRGRLTLISKESAQAWMQLLEAESPGPQLQRGIG